MLKNHGPSPRVTLPRIARVLTIAALGAIGLLIAGLRGPVGDSSALAQDRAIEHQAAGAASDSHNLAFLPPDASMIISVRPQFLLRRRDVMSLLNSLRESPSLINRIPVPLEDVEQWLLFWESGAGAEAGAGRGPMLPPPSGFVLRMSRPQDWKAVLEKLGGPRLVEARQDGRVYYRLNGVGPQSWGVYPADEQTLVASEEVVLRDLIADRNAPLSRHPWDEAWQRVPKGQVMLGLDTRWLRRRLAQATAGPAAPGAMLTFETFAPLYEKARSYAVSINASDPALAIDLVAAAGSPENARPVVETLQAVVTLGKNALEGLRREVDRKPRARSEGLESVLQAGDSLLEKARVETTERFVRLHSEVDLAEVIRLLVPAVSSARAASRRTASVNNLKQIGLAFHNYAQVKDHFPASVNRDRGNFPYSWRVAILPYIEQQELYNQYRFDEPWDGPNNRKLLDKMPAIYAYPGQDGDPPGPSNTAYFVFTGKSTIGGVEGGAKIMQITDGTSNTILAVEVKRDIPWTKPEDISFDANAGVPELGGFSPNGFNALFADGSVRFISKSVDPVVLKALITQDGGEVVGGANY
jgi:prepilin-type processing-associated H-X9-DG protein